MNTERHVGFDDWKLLKKQKVEALDEAAALARLAQKERVVDPTYYPKLRGAAGVFKVKPENVENSMVVKAALSGAADLKVPKAKARADERRAGKESVSTGRHRGAPDHRK